LRINFNNNLFPPEVKQILKSREVLTKNKLNGINIPQIPPKNLWACELPLPWWEGAGWRGHNNVTRPEPIPVDGPRCPVYDTN
jgi:hypothetical protein